MSRPSTHMPWHKHPIEYQDAIRISAAPDIADWGALTSRWGGVISLGSGVQLTTVLN